MMVLPPRSFTPQCEALRDQDIPRVLALQNNYRRAIGEPQMTQTQQAALRNAVESGAVHFFVARRLTRVVGMRSVCRIFSADRCAAAGIFEDFYIEPAFRGQGIARRLTKYVRKACAGEGMISLWVGCSSVDMPRYQALGFSLPRGNLLTWNQSTPSTESNDREKNSS